VGQQPPPAGDTFLFLTLRMRTGEVSVVRSQIVPGTLKPQPAPRAPEPLAVVLEDSDGTELATARLDDPSLRRFEYEDPDQPGAIKARTVPVDDTEFIVRVPQPARATRVAVYREAAGAAGTGSTERVKPPDRKLLKRLDLPKAQEAK
jgi:hypothetical protein